MTSTRTAAGGGLHRGLRRHLLRHREGGGPHGALRAARARLRPHLQLPRKELLRAQLWRGLPYCCLRLVPAAESGALQCTGHGSNRVGAMRPSSEALQGMPILPSEEGICPCIPPRWRSQGSCCARWCEDLRVATGALKQVALQGQHLAIVTPCGAGGQQYGDANLGTWGKQLFTQ
jgi:hypothetical protein